METLADRAYRLAAHHASPALPFPLLVRLLRQEGCPVTAGVLFSSLRRDTERFRLLDPWRGPLAALAPLARNGAPPGDLRVRSGAPGPAGRGPRRTSMGHPPHEHPGGSTVSGDEHPGVASASHADPSEGTRAARVLVVAVAPAASTAVADRMRWALTMLGRDLDEGSMLDRSRWLRLLAEAARFPASA